MSLRDLITASTKEDFMRLLFGLAKDAGFDVESWQERTVPRKTIEVVADAMSKLSNSLIGLAESAFLSTAKKAWLTLVAKEIFGLEREGATRAYRNVTIANYSGSTLNVPAFGASVRVAGTEIYFTNTTAIGPLADGAATMVTFQSSEFGISQNSVNLGLEIVSGLPDSSLISSLISSVAADEERDEALRQRCKDQWNLIAKATDDWYAATARNFSKRIKKVSVARGTPSAGSTTVYIADEAGLCPSGTAASLENHYDPKPSHLGVAGWADNTYATDGTPVVFNINGTVSILAEDFDAAKLEIQNELLAYQIELPMGGIVSRNEIVEIIMRALPRKKGNKLSLTSPIAEETTLAINEFAVFNTLSLAFETV